MTDAPEEPPVVPRERGGVRRPRVGDSGSPVGSTLSIILAVIAVIAGFLILRAITDDDTSADGGVIEGPGATTATTPGIGSVTVDPSLPTTTGSPTSAPPAAGAVYSGATIAVANASGIGGSAGQMSTALETEGYEGIGEPGDSTGGELDASIVYYVPGDAAAQAVAQSIATDLGGAEIAEMPDPRPAEGGDVADATVLVMLGLDAADQTLAELSGGATGATGGTGATDGTTADTVVPPPAIITQPEEDG